MDRPHPPRSRLRLRRARPAARLLAVGLAAGVAAAAAIGAPVRFATVDAAQTSALGKIIVSPKGRTLYHYGSDTNTTVKCLASCARAWPPLVIPTGTKPLAGPGVSASLLGTVKRPDGTTQVTYAGKPLYLYSGDAKAGDVKGQGSDGSWHAVAPSGAVVTRAPATAASGAGGATTGTGSGTSTGSGTGTGSGSTGGGSSGSGGTSGGGSTDCTANPGGYGCM